VCCSRLAFWRSIAWRTNHFLLGDKRELLANSSNKTAARCWFRDLFSAPFAAADDFRSRIMAVHTASIILQLLTWSMSHSPNWQKEGEMGRKKITQWTRYSYGPVERP